MTRVYAWNPRKPLLPGRLAQYSRFGARLSNFGDLLGPIVVDLMKQRFGLRERPDSGPERTLFSVGSVLHEAADDDVVWGSGVNGKKRREQHIFTRLDVRAVRGPRTAAFLRGMGIDVPDVFGDPALLLPLLMPEMSEWAQQKKRRVAVVPNFNERAQFKKAPGFIDPLGDPFRIIRDIAASERVVGSSLHGLVLAEALGIPAVGFASGVELPFKYEDYFAGTGRGSNDVTMAADLPEALRLVETATADLSWTPDPLIAAFPQDIWTRTTHEES